MKFKAVFSTEDGRLTKGKVYRGNFCSIVDIVAVRGELNSQLRIAVYDNLGQWMTFAPKAFEPA